MRSGLDAADVGAVAGIDLDELSLVDEEGHAHLGAGLDGRGLEGVGGCVAFEAGLSIGDLEDGLYGHLGEEHGFSGGVGHDFDSVAFLHESGAGDELFLDRNLLESLVVHEDIVVAVGIEILERAALHSYVFEFLADIEAAFEYAAVDNVLELSAHESVAFAGLYVEEFYTEVETAVHADAGAVFDVLSVDHIINDIYFRAQIYEKCVKLQSIAFASTR